MESSVVNISAWHEDGGDQRQVAIYIDGNFYVKAKMRETLREIDKGVPGNDELRIALGQGRVSYRIDRPMHPDRPRMKFDQWVTLDEIRAICQRRQSVVC